MTQPTDDDIIAAADDTIAAAFEEAFVTALTEPRPSAQIPIRCTLVSVDKPYERSSSHKPSGGRWRAIVTFEPFKVAIGDGREVTFGGIVKVQGLQTKHLKRGPRTVPFPALPNTQEQP